MKCPQCEADRDVKDFMGKEICFRCQYQNKIKKPVSNGILTCKICGTEFKKMSRWIYCSWECQQKAESQQKKDYWTNHVEKR